MKKPSPKLFTVTEWDGEHEVTYETDEMPKTSAPAVSVRLNYAVPYSVIDALLAEQDE